MTGVDISLVGHPFAPTGRGEDVRCTFRALRSVGVSARLVDLYGLARPEAQAQQEFGPFLQPSIEKVNVFHINGDEVEQALATIANRPAPSAAYNVVYPAWELSRYPQEWARQLELFDEVWAPSRFIEAGLREAVSKPVFHMPLACEPVLSSFLGRRWFGLSESAYAFLFFFDLRSYAARKHPEAILAAFRKLIAQRPYSDCVLVLKVHGEEGGLDGGQQMREAAAGLRDRVVLIERTMTDNEVKNLVRCCDCFVSLHRSEGFGRGLIEAMYLGKPVIGTAYSGNMDYMAPDNSLLVDYQLVPVKDGQYPHWKDQVWAEADLEQAAAHMIRLVDQPQFGVALGRDAACHVRSHFSYKAAGVRCSRRFDAIRLRASNTAPA